MAHRLTERQKRFADYYLELGNARKAAVKAGFQISYAEAVKARPTVKSYIEERIAAMDRQRIADADEVLSFFTRILRNEDGDSASSVQMKAAELLAKRLGLLSDNEEKPERVQLIDDISDYPNTVNAAPPK